MIRLPDQRENEVILEIIQKDSIVYGKLLLSFIVVAVMPMVLVMGIWIGWKGADWNSEGFLITAMIACFYGLFWLLYFCMAWINEEFDLFIVTDERVIDITQISLFNRSVSTTPLEQIQDTTGTVSGFLPTIFNFGNIEIQTASGEATKIFIDHVDDPVHRARRILSWANAKKEGKPLTPWDKKDHKTEEGLA